MVIKAVDSLYTSDQIILSGICLKLFDCSFDVLSLCFPDYHIIHLIKVDSNPCIVFHLCLDSSCIEVGVSSVYLQFLFTFSCHFCRFIFRLYITLFSEVDGFKTSKEKQPLTLSLLS